jgi:uroporphyrinogen-III synthase
VSAPPAAPLSGRTVALPESRELDQLSQLLEQQGATALRCPLVQILDAPDAAPVDAWLGRLIGGAFDDVILLTGEGLRRLLGRAQRTGAREAAVAALARVRRITRGPKPARALREIGLASDLPAPVPTSRGIVDALAGADLRGRRIGLQLYGATGQEPSAELVTFLRAAGAIVDTVAPYVYAPASDDERVRALIASMAAGRVDAIAFTSASQIDRLWQVARADGGGGEAALAAALGKTAVAAIGPVAAAALAERGARVDIGTEKPFVMKHLVALIAEKLTGG